MSKPLTISEQYDLDAERRQPQMQIDLTRAKSVEVAANILKHLDHVPEATINEKLKLISDIIYESLHVPLETSP